MSNFQNIPDANFTIVRNEMLRNDKLSLKAKGLLAMMRSFPPDWTYRQSHLVKLSTDGRDSMRAGLKELLDYGYITRHQSRNPDGTLGEAVYRVTDAEPTVDGFSGDGEPDDGKAEATNTYRTKTEGTKEKPSSTSVDAHAEKKEASASTTPSPREVPASASPKGSPPSSAAPPLSELRELAEVWNQHRGRLREFRSLAGRRVTNLKRLVRQCAEAGADPKLVVRLAAQELSKDEHYLAGKYDLENAIQSGRIAKFIDDALAPQPGEGLVVGQLYVWPRDPSRPWAGNLMGAFTGNLLEVRGRTFATMEIDGVTYRAPVDSLEPKK